MGNNAAFKQFEEIIIDLYDAGKLDLAILNKIGKRFWVYPDIDTGGSENLLTDDGKDVFEVIVRLVNPTFVPDESEENYWGWCDEFSEYADSSWRK